MELKEILTTWRNGRTTCLSTALDILVSPALQVLVHPWIPTGAHCTSGMQSTA
jgi:hypothetical protein